MLNPIKYWKNVVRNNNSFAKVLIILDDAEKLRMLSENMSGLVNVYYVCDTNIAHPRFCRIEEEHIENVLKNIDYIYDEHENWLTLALLNGATKLDSIDNVHLLEPTSKLERIDNWEFGKNLVDKQL